MKLSHDRVEKVAKLANLELSLEETVKYSEQLSAILDYVEQIESVDTMDTEPVFNISGRETVMRDDKVKPGLSQSDALSNGKNVSNGLFSTKGVFVEE